MIPSTLKSSVAVGAVVVIGILAGLYVGTGLAQHSQQGLPFAVWVPRQQAEVGLFKNFMPSLGWAAALLPAAAAVLLSGSRRVFFAIAAALILATIVSTSFGEIPLNQQVFTWNAAVPIPGWEQTREAWLHFHWIKTSMSVAALIAAAVGLSRSAPTA